MSIKEGNEIDDTSATLVMIAIETRWPYEGRRMCNQHNIDACGRPRFCPFVKGAQCEGSRKET